MIEGRVTPDGREALVRLAVRGPEGGEQSITAVIDTGFDSFLTLPQRLIRALDLPRRGVARAMLADGSLRDVGMYAAEVIWDGEPRRIEVEEAETTPLIGMDLLAGYAVADRVPERRARRDRKASRVIRTMMKYREQLGITRRPPAQGDRPGWGGVGI